MSLLIAKSSSNALKMIIHPTYSRFNVCIRLIRTCGIVSKVGVERHRTACFRASLNHWCPATRLLKWRLDLSVVLRLRFQCYSASVDAAQTRDYQSGFEPSANINLALSHRQNIDMFHVQTYLPLGSDTLHGSCSPLALIPYSPTNSHSNPR